jgi:glycine/D-amino acid oxidase-like deaminating enzyme
MKSKVRPVRASEWKSSATEMRDLRTGVPVWAAYDRTPLACDLLLSPLKADLVVVGAGITGALLAFGASRKGLSTVVLDRRPPGHGSTAASTALLQWELDRPLIRLAEEIGFSRASRAWRRSFQAVGDLQRLIAQQRIPCNARPRRALYLAGPLLNASGLAEEGEQRRRAGLPSAALDWQDLLALANIDREAALLSEGVADLDPVQLTLGLLHRARLAGCRIFSPTQLADIAATSKNVTMVTADGIELEAKALVFATGYELAKDVPAKGHRRTSTWAFATPPQPHALWNQEALIWEADQPYLYMRATADGRVVVGGEDEEFSDEAKRDAILPVKIERLQAKLRRLFPRLDVTAEFAWAGTFGESASGLPSIGPVPGMPNCYAVLGYGGNGFTFGMIAAQIIGARLIGRDAPDAALFAFGGNEP